MSAWLIVWFVIGIVTTIAVIAVLIALGRHALVLGRSAKEFQEQVKPLADEISSGGAKASRKASALKVPAPSSSRRTGR